MRAYVQMVQLSEKNLRTDIHIGIISNIAMQLWVKRLQSRGNPCPPEPGPTVLLHLECHPVAGKFMVGACGWGFCIALYGPEKPYRYVRSSK